MACAGWWREKDSNLRRQCRQIYSLIPLTARESLHGTQGADYIRAGELVKHLLHPAQTSRRVAQSPRKPAQASRRVAQSSRSPAQSLRRPARFSSQPEQFSSQPEQFSSQPAQTPRGMAQSPGRTSHGLEDLAQGSGEISRTSRRVSRASRRASCGLREMDEELRGLAGKSRGCTESSGKSERENKILKNNYLATKPRTTAPNTRFSSTSHTRRSQTIHHSGGRRQRTAIQTTSHSLAILPLIVRLAAVFRVAASP